jgi:hypothetical protein
MIVGMENNPMPTPAPTTSEPAGTPGRPVQLTLLGRPELPARFKFSNATRERGRRHAAEIRAQLEARQAAANDQPARRSSRHAA